MHNSHTQAFPAKLRSFPDNPQKEMPGISQLETNLKEMKTVYSQYNAQIQCDKSINPRSYLQIKELDYNQSLHNHRHKVFIWKTDGRLLQKLKRFKQ